MRIIVAPDSFKGSLSAIEAANAIKRGIQKVFTDAEIISVPIADGGEGTVRSLIYSTHGELVTTRVIGPLGDEVDATWGILGAEKTAVIEMAEASGLLLVPMEKRNPLIATTYGTGQLIKEALDRGFRKIIIGLGGSATNDGGAGMAQALGAKFLDMDGNELPYGGMALDELAKIDLAHLDPRIEETEFILASDVKNPLCGADGATAVYGPQKGANEEMVRKLEFALSHYGKIAEKTMGKSVICSAGAGAAGGLGAGLMLFCNAYVREGIQFILQTIHAEEIFAEADLIFTGEGSTDAQTIYGKAPVGIGFVAEKYRVPVICVSGNLGNGYDEIFHYGIAGAESIVPGPMTLAACMENAAVLLEDAVMRICLILKIGSRLNKFSIKD